MKLMLNLIGAGAVALATTTPSHGAVSYNGWPVLAALAGMPPEWSDRNETKRERIERLKPWAHAIEHVARNNEERAALLALINHETMAASRIQWDKCRPDECGGPAKGLLQVQRDACVEAKQIYSMPPSPERFKLEARCAISVYRSSKKRCKGKNRLAVTDGLSGYRGVCRTTDGKLRTNTYLTMESVVGSGWPVAPHGWVRDSTPALPDRKTALARFRELDVAPGDFFKLPSGAGVLVEWHFHEFSGPISPKGWHVGFSLFYLPRNDNP